MTDTERLVHELTDYFYARNAKILDAVTACTHISAKIILKHHEPEKAREVFHNIVDTVLNTQIEKLNKKPNP